MDIIMLYVLIQCTIHYSIAAGDVSMYNNKYRSILMEYVIKNNKKTFVSLFPNFSATNLSVKWIQVRLQLSP